MRILLTGGAGYIGAHAARALKQRGHEVLVYDSLIKGHRKAASGFKFIKGDTGDSKKLKKVFAAHRPDAVMHFAAFIEVGESVQNPGKYYQNNTVKTIALLDSMVEAGVKNFVFSSTAATFGNPVADLIDETHPQNPINPYGASKLMVERVLADYAAAHGLRYAALRYFNACGAHPSGRIGEAHQPESHLIPLILQAAKGTRADIKIFGQDYPTPDGTCVRDYVHVCDLADAHILALERMVKDGASDSFNLGIGRGYSVLEVINAVKRLTGRDFMVTPAPRREGDPAILVASGQKARQVLGWQPKYDLEQIIQSAWKWENNRRY